MSSLGQSMKGLQEAVTIREGTSQQKELFGLKFWQLGLLLGVPTALVVAYLMYRKKPSEASTKKSDKSASEETSKTKTDTPKKKIENMVRRTDYSFSKFVKLISVN